MKPQGMRFTVIDTDHAQVEVNFNYSKLLCSILLVIGCGLIGFGIWVQAAFGGGIVIIIISLLFLISGYIFYTWKKSLVIDKTEGRVRVIREIGFLCHKVLYQWAIDQILEFEAKTRDVFGASHYAPSSGSRVLDIIDNLVWGVEHGKSDNLGFLDVKLKTGQIIRPLQHNFPNAPQNCAEHANLFLKGEYTTPGTIYD